MQHLIQLFIPLPDQVPKLVRFEVDAVVFGDIDVGDGDGDHPGKIKKHIPSQMIRSNLSENIVGLDHQPRHFNLLVDLPDHHLGVDGLAGPADEIVVGRAVEVDNAVYIGQRQVGNQVVHVKGVFRQLDAALPQQIGAVEHGVHQHQLVEAESLHALPGDNLALGENIVVAHDFVLAGIGILIDIIGDQQVDGIIGAQEGKDGQVVRGIQPVVAVDHFEISAPGHFQSAVDCRAMTAVCFLLQADNAGKAAAVFPGNLRCPVGGAVIDHDYFCLRPAEDNRVEAVTEIILGII